MKCEIGNQMSSGVSFVTINFNAGFSSEPSMVMTIMGLAGNNEADLRYNNQGSSSWQFRVEETPANDNTGHSAENCSFVAFEKGLIYGAKHLSSEPVIYFGGNEEKNAVTHIASKYYYDMVRSRYKCYGLKIKSKYGEPYFAEFDIKIDDPVEFFKYIA